MAALRCREFFIVVVYLLTRHALTTDSKQVLVNTLAGPIRGVRVTEIYDLGRGQVTNTVDKFLGIPYAEPPVGKRRFKPPEPPSNWEEARDASKHGAVCPQITFHPKTSEEFQDEDCLFLDVYVPYQEDDPDAVYPVMIFIHGGSFEVGSGKLYDGTVLAQLGVIVVTINYRLGALGFMSAGTDVLSGNLGIMDQIMSLQWVHDNIASFHGNPNSVTVFGHSAGGASVGLLLVMPKANGLFHGIIAQSGSAVASYCIHDDTIDFKEYVRNVGHLYDCHDDNMTEILECLRAVSARDFINRRMEFPLYDPIDPEFRPYLDGTWITDYPMKLFQWGYFQKVPVMTGTLQNEFGNYFNGGARYRSAFDDALDRYVGSYVRHSDVMEVVRFEYKDWNRSSAEEYDRGSVLSDMHMHAPTVELAELVSHHSHEIYQYHFSIDNCYHSVELNYVFGAPFSGRMADEMSVNKTPEFSPADKEFSLRMMTMWTNFAKYGNPTPAVSAGIPKWPPFTYAEKSYLLLHPEGSTVGQRLRQDKVAFWNKLIPKLRRPRDSRTRTASRSGDDRICRSSIYRVNLWMFIAIVSVLFVLVLLLTILLTKAQIQNKKYKQTLCMDVSGAETKPRKV